MDDLRFEFLGNQLTRVGGLVLRGRRMGNDTDGLIRDRLICFPDREHEAVSGAEKHLVRAYCD